MNGTNGEEGDVLRVVVVDDEPLVRTGLQMILSCMPGIEVLDSCDGPAALATVARHRPGIVLLDINMPGTDGITALQHIRALPDPPVVAMLTTFSADEYVRDALRHGAAGFLLKDTDPDQLAYRLRSLASGERPLDPVVAGTVINGYLAAPRKSEASRAVRSLTAREREALSLLGQGLTNNQLARRMGLAPSTAKDHVSAVLAKLGRLNRVQAAVLAHRAGLIPERASSTPQTPSSTPTGRTPPTFGRTGS